MLRVAAVVSPVLVLVTLGGPAPATQGSGAARVDVYSDGWITVVSPRSHGQVDLGEHTTLSGGYGVDFVSAATPSYAADLVSSATRVEETRHQADLALSVELPRDWTVGLSYAVSLEPDHSTHVLGADLGLSLAGDMTTLGAAYHVAFEQVSLATGEDFRDQNLQHTLDLSSATILGPRTTLTLLATGSAARCGDYFGCQANPYRFVAVQDAGSVFAAREHHPEERLRGSLGARLSQRLVPGLALHLGYRLYGDSWSIVGHTGTATLAWSLLKGRLFLRAEGRAVYQSAASFYHDGYHSPAAVPSVPRYRTADPELSRLWGGSAGLAAEWGFDNVGPLRRLALTARVRRLWYHYADVIRRPERKAWIAGAGLQTEF